MKSKNDFLFNMISLDEHLFLAKANHNELRFGVFDAFDKGIVPVYRSFLE